MRTTTVSALAPILPALSTFITGSSRIGRAGKRVRVYRVEPSLVTTAKVNEAVKTLLEQGYKVRVYEHTVIYHPTIIADTVVWERRNTCRTRNYTCVEVEL